MADDFSGLVKHHLDEMRLEEEEQGALAEKQTEVIETESGAREEADSDAQPSVQHSIRDPSPRHTPTPPSSTRSSRDVPSRSRDSTTSSSSTSSSEVQVPPPSLETFRAPTIDYSRDNDHQRLVAVIGREFDEPVKTVCELQKLSWRQDLSTVAVMKFVPYTVARGTLRKCKFDWRDLRLYDLICLCYNASEARILLTGTDGFYTTLLRNLEALVGTVSPILCLCN